MSSTIIHAQAKHDYVWIIGHSGEGSTIDFSNGIPEVSFNDISMHHHSANSSICDSLGNLLFYSNGSHIANTDNETIENSLMELGILSIAPPYGPNVPQIVMTLPSLHNSNQFYVFYKSLTVDQNQMNPESHLYYLVVDLSLNGGLGGIIQKDVLLLDGVYLDWGELTACKHANGRDWWILQAESDTERYFRFLLTPNGVVEFESQEVGVPVQSGLGQAAFSPDGTMYARLNMIDYNTGNFVDIYDFDRCSGLLSNQLHFNYADSAFAGGLAFSPNSRFLYVSSTNFLHQYDLEAQDVVASKEVVGIFDGTLAPWFPASFYLCQLAPDNKIYINAPNGVDVMHVINQPDEQGLACDFQQHSIQLPAINAFSMPNFPYFRLGALEGSPCDTIGVSAVEEMPMSSVVDISPNPATHSVHVNLPDGTPSATLTFHTATGVPALTQRLTAGWNTVPLEDMAPGLYLYEVHDGGRRLGSGKLVVAE